MEIKRKPYTRMTLAELREATKEFDEEIPLERTRPLTPAERRTFRAMQRGERTSLYAGRTGKVLAINRGNVWYVRTKRPPKWLLGIFREDTEPRTARQVSATNH